MQRSLRLTSVFILILFSLCSAAGRFFHFLPPNYPEWSSGGIELVYGDGTKERMRPDTNHCGWWIANPPATGATSKTLLQVLTLDTLHQLGVKGASFDLPQKINFDSLFTAIPNSGHLYYAPESFNSFWSASFPNLARACTRSIATIIYDTDPASNPAFYSSDAPRNSIPCVGVTKGIAQPKIGTANKPKYNSTSNCFENESAFNSLFQGMPSSDKSCYDIDLKLSSQGYFEYDSREESQGGFFPLSGFSSTTSTQSEAFSTVKLGSGLGSHSLNNINSKATSSGLFAEGINWGSNSLSAPVPVAFQYPVQQGEFADSTHPNLYDMGSWATRKKSMQNLDFCLETHFPFTARPGQSIYYYGDDDLWLFVDSNLVMDLGGLHFPAPGGILFDTLPNMKEGTKHQLHLFHCNRLSPTSTFVFKTNIQFPIYTASSLFYDRDPITGAYIIRSLKSGTSSCTAIVGQDSETFRPLPLRHTITDVNGDTLDADPSSLEFDKVIPENKVVWGGIRVHQDSVWVDSAKINLPVGRYRVTVESLFPRGKLSITIRIMDPSAIRRTKSNPSALEEKQKKNFTAHGKTLRHEQEYQGAVFQSR